jgi:hypothetical protein|tara:strand:+ start:1341 stop:2306 length:966 start_codon:yes stop_codon:yes gene_type:complete
MKTLSEVFVAPSIARALAEAERITRLFDGQCRDDVANWDLGTTDREFLRLVERGRISGRALLSNGRVHRIAQIALINALADDYIKQPDRQRLWCTLAWDAGVTWERKPEIDLVSLKAIARQHLWRSGLEGFGVIEIDMWKNMTGEPGRRMVAHVHFLGTRAEGNLAKVLEMEADMQDRRALTNSLGARSVVIRNAGQSVDDLTWLGQYMLKRPAFAKNPIPKSDGDGYRLQDVAHARGSAVRLLEVMSHIEVGDVIFSIGSGRPIANKVRSAVRQEVASRAGAAPAPLAHEVTRHWRDIREKNRHRRLEPCQIITRAEQRR